MNQEEQPGDCRSSDGRAPGGLGAARLRESNMTAAVDGQRLAACHVWRPFW